MGPTWVLSAPGEPHVGLMNHAIWVNNWAITSFDQYIFLVGDKSLKYLIKPFTMVVKSNFVYFGNVVEEIL